MGARGEGVYGTPGYLAPEMALREAIDARRRRPVRALTYACGDPVDPA